MTDKHKIGLWFIAYNDTPLALPSISVSPPVLPVSQIQKLMDFNHRGNHTDWDCSVALSLNKHQGFISEPHYAIHPLNIYFYKCAYLICAGVSRLRIMRPRNMCVQERKWEIDKRERETEKQRDMHSRTSLREINETIFLYIYRFEICCCEWSVATNGWFNIVFISLSPWRIRFKSRQSTSQTH